MNRKVLASAMTVGVLSAPVAIAVADTNDTNTNDIPAGPTAQVSKEARDTANLKRAAARAELRREEKARKKAEARKRAKKRAKARKQAAAAPQQQTAAAPQQAGGGSTAPGNLQAIAACESGGNPGAVDSSGTYRGKYQFDQQTWASVGGSGDPASAPEAEQDKRAAMLYSRTGASSWPVCGK